ncbi:MAG: HIT domain-containing protein [Clostridiales bacterium]|nr:HIT domain-containing protein [Candidatus Apopatousia equi]
MEDCIFCKIRDGVIPSPKVFKNDDFFIINDIDPKAKHHYLAIPKKHFKLIDEMGEEELGQLEAIYKTLPSLKTQLGLDNGYRMIINQGDDAGQSVPHLHIHILGGEELGWKPNK